MERYQNFFIATIFNTSLLNHIKQGRDNDYVGYNVGTLDYG